MGVTLHSLARNYFVEVETGISDSATEVVIIDAGKTPPATPFWAMLGSECVEVTGISEDDPEAGQDTFTITRGQQGTSAAAHLAGALLKQYANPFEITELQTLAAVLNRLLVDMAGGGDGVQRRDSGTQLKVVAQGTPDMTVQVSTGSAVVDGCVVAVLAAENTDTITAPTGNPRIDLVQINSDGEISVKEGTEAGSPVAPTADSGNLGLAQIYLRVGSTSIKNTDDSTNGYITDARTYV